jgi:hypothetical protein
MPTVADMIGGHSALPRVQGQAEWVRQRIGHLTASNMKRVIVFSHKNGWRRATAASREKLMFELVAERAKDAALDHLVTDAMQHGIDHEPDCLAAYERLKRVSVLPAEFILHPTIAFFGGTPDGLVGADGGVEGKCPATTTYVDWRVAKKIPEEHVPQIASYLCITGRQWWDLAAYDPRVKKGPNLTVWRYVPTEEDIEYVTEEATQFLRQVELVFHEYVETEIV